MKKEVGGELFTTAAATIIIDIATADTKAVNSVRSRNHNISIGDSFYLFHFLKILKRFISTTYQKRAASVLN